MIKHTEICLDSLADASRSQCVDVPVTRREEGGLRQHSRLRGVTRHLTLFNGHYLEWEESLSGRVNSRRQINLAFIDPQPVFRRVLARERLLAGALALCLAAAAPFVASWTLAAVLAGVGMVLLMTGYQRSCDRAVFLTRHGRLAVFELFCRAPNRREASAWIELISERARHAAAVLPPGQQGLAAEMADHRRMAAEGWLSRARYELARKRILAAFGGQVRGSAGGTRVPAATAPTSRQSRGTVSEQIAHLAS